VIIVEIENLAQTNLDYSFSYRLQKKPFVRKLKNGGAICSSKTNCKKGYFAAITCLQFIKNNSF